MIQGTKYLHKNGNEYIFLEQLNVEDAEGNWHDGVLYQNKEGKKFTRTLKRFLNSFSPIEKH